MVETDGQGVKAGLFAAQHFLFYGSCADGPGFAWAFVDLFSQMLDDSTGLCLEGQGLSATVLNQQVTDFPVWESADVLEHERPTALRTQITDLFLRINRFADGEGIVADSF
jgi:hypothetical protein